MALFEHRRLVALTDQQHIDAVVDVRVALCSRGVGNYFCGRRIANPETADDVCLGLRRNVCCCGPMYIVTARIAWGHGYVYQVKLQSSISRWFCEALHSPHLRRECVDTIIMQ